MMKVEIPYSTKYMGNYYKHTVHTCNGCKSTESNTYDIVFVEIDGEKWHSNCYKNDLGYKLQDATEMIENGTHRIGWNKSWKEGIAEMEQALEDLKGLYEKFKQFMGHVEYKILLGYFPGENPYNNNKYIDGARHVKKMGFNNRGQLNFIDHLNFNVKKGRSELLSRIIISDESDESDEFKDKEMLREALRYAEEWELELESN